jgi:hypothetical protein
MPDVDSVPEAAGREALARLLGYGQPAVAPGPVALSAAGRVLFYVADGGAQDLPELLEWLDWGGVRLDLTAVPAEELADPPVRWLHPSTVPMQRPGTPGTAGPPPNGVDTPNTPSTPNGSHSASSQDGLDNSPDSPESTDATGDAGGVRGAREGVAMVLPGTARRPAYPTPGLPEAPELIALLATLAAACQRLAVAAAR